jgi:hypothetical protein
VNAIRPRRSIAMMMRNMINGRCRLWGFPEVEDESEDIEEVVVDE